MRKERYEEEEGLRKERYGGGRGMVEGEVWYSKVNSPLEVGVM